MRLVVCYRTSIAGAAKCLAGHRALPYIPTKHCLATRGSREIRAAERVQSTFPESVTALCTRAVSVAAAAPAAVLGAGAEARASGSGRMRPLPSFAMRYGNRSFIMSMCGSILGAGEGGVNSGGALEPQGSLAPGSGQPEGSGTQAGNGALHILTCWLLCTFPAATVVPFLVMPAILRHDGL